MINRAVGMSRFGGPEVLTVVSRSMPVPEAGDVRIRVSAAAVNPTDVWMRTGNSAKALRGIPPPWTPGMDLAGTVDMVGPDVEFTVGDTVIAIVVPLRPLGGAQAEYVVVPARSVARVPPSLPLTDAATIPLNALTARLALDTLGLEPGQSLAVTGGAGALGGYAIQLAKIDGLTVVATGSAPDAPLLSDLGADVVVERGREVEMTRAAVPAGVDAAIDCAVIGPKILPAVRDEGQVAAVRAWRDPSERGIRIHPIWITDYIANTPALERLAGLASSGRLTLRVAHAFAPERAAAAHRLLEAGGLRGRCVIDFD